MCVGVAYLCDACELCRRVGCGGREEDVVVGLEARLLSPCCLIILRLDGRTTAQQKERGEREGMGWQRRGLGGVSGKPCMLPLLMYVCGCGVWVWCCVVPGAEPVVLWHGLEGGVRQCMCHSALQPLSLYESHSSILSSWSFLPHPLQPG